MSDEGITEEEKALEFVKKFLKGEVPEKSQERIVPALSYEQETILDEMVGRMFLHLKKHEAEDPCSEYNKVIKKVVDRHNFYARDGAINSNRESEKTAKLLYQVINLLTLFHELWHDMAEGINALTGENDDA